MQLKFLFLGKNNALTEILKFLKIGMRLNGIIFTRISLETFEEVLAAVRKDMMQLLASGHNEEYNFGSDAAECTLVIIRMISSCQIGYFPREEMKMKHAFVNESTYDESYISKRDGRLNGGIFQREFTPFSKACVKVTNKELQLTGKRNLRS